MYFYCFWNQGCHHSVVLELVVRFSIGANHPARSVKKLGRTSFHCWVKKGRPPSEMGGNSQGKIYHCGEMLLRSATSHDFDTSAFHDYMHELIVILNINYTIMLLSKVAYTMAIKSTNYLACGRVIFKH